MRSGPVWATGLHRETLSQKRPRTCHSDLIQIRVGGINRRSEQEEVGPEALSNQRL
jgi:hypothetical protein